MGRRQTVIEVADPNIPARICNICKKHRREDDFYPRRKHCKFCAEEYRRNRRKAVKDGTWNPTHKPRVTNKKDPIERFWSKVEKQENGCWVWLGTIYHGKHPKFSVNRRPVPATRFSWELKFGKIPDNKLVRRNCGNPACVNPDHLVVGGPSPCVGKKRSYKERLAVRQGRINSSPLKEMWEANGYPEIGRIQDRLLYQRMNMLWRSYRMTLKEYDDILESQSNVCAICGDPPEKWYTQRLVVDHNHGTGQLRGLLCDPCNRMLGHLENEAWVSRAAEYLKKYKDTGENI